METLSEPPTRDGFQLAVICALPEERDAVEKAMTRDYKGEGHVYGRAQGDDNHYTTGELGRKPIVLAAPSNMSTTNISHLVVNMRQSFPNLVYAFVVGIAGGAPFKYDKQTDMWSDSDIFLGDIVVSTQVIEYDFGAELDDRFKRKVSPALHGTSTEELSVKSHDPPFFGPPDATPENGRKSSHKCIFLVPDMYHKVLYTH
jgi:nucleoside phosphorylase